MSFLVPLARALVRAPRAFFVATFAFLPGCSPIDALNVLVPADGYESVEGIRYGEDDRRRLDVHRPSGLAGPAPVVVFFYGGSWRAGARGDYRFVAEALTSRGIVTVIPDYRLAPEHPFPAFLEDGAAAVAWTLDEIAAYGGDPERVFLAGHSAGAHIAALLALDESRLSAAGVSREDVAGLIGLAGPYEFDPLASRSLRSVFGGVPDIELTQPVRFADAGAPPAFLATGDADRVVEPRNSQALAQHLRDAGVPVDLRTYQGKGHVTLILALSLPFRDGESLLDDIAGFVAETTEARGG